MAEIKFTGNLGGEPKMDYKQSGNACLAFNVADTKGKKDQNGQWDKSQEQTRWFRCTLWGPDAEYYVERLRTGARVTVFGDFMAREYVDRDGVNRTSMDVTVRGLSVINKKVSANAEPAKADPTWAGAIQGGNEESAGGWGNQQTGQGGWG